MLTSYYPERPKKPSETGGPRSEGIVREAFDMREDGLSQQSLGKGMSDTAMKLGSALDQSADT